MKPTTSKVLTILSAVGMSIYTLFMLLMQIPAMHTALYAVLRYESIGREIYWAMPMWVLSIAIILVFDAFLFSYKQVTNPIPSKPFRILTYCLTVLLLLTIISAFFSMSQIYGVFYLWGATILRIPLLIMSVVWLYMLCRETNVGVLSKGLRIAIIVSSVLMAAPLLLQVISAIAYLTTGHLLFLHSTAIYTWLRYLIPIILLCWYSAELYKSSKI